MKDKIVKQPKLLALIFSLMLGIIWFGIFALLRLLVHDTGGWITAEFLVFGVPLTITTFIVFYYYFQRVKVGESYPLPLKIYFITIWIFWALMFFSWL